MTDTGPTVGELLRSLRAQRQWSLREVERRSGGTLKSGYLSQLENGKVQQPGLPVLRALARAFNYDLRVFLSLLNAFDADVAALNDRELLVLTYFADLADREQAEALEYLAFKAQRGRDERRHDARSNA